MTISKNMPLVVLNEQDPNGLDQHAPGAKLDMGKQMVGMVLEYFSRALLAVSDVGTYGANKYSRGGWQYVADGRARYFDAMCRHMLKHSTGEARDQESGFLHLAHRAWNDLAELELYLREQENDLSNRKLEESSNP